jgi:hypothetical protein
VIEPFALLISCSKNFTVKKILQTKTDKTTTKLLTELTELLDAGKV